MLVVVLAVSCVPAPVVNVVDVITVRDGHMAAPLAVNVVMTLVDRVLSGGLAFVVVTLVRSMKMTVVHIVDVVTVWDRDMSASLAVNMVMAGVFFVGSSHRLVRLSECCYTHTLALTHTWLRGVASASPIPAFTLRSTPTLVENPFHSADATRGGPR